MLSLESQQVAYVAEWWRSTVKTWIDGSYRTTIERHFITDFITVNAVIAVGLNLPLLEFNMNAKNVICQFLVFDGCFRNFHEWLVVPVFAHTLIRLVFDRVVRSDVIPAAVLRLIRI